MTLKNAIKLSLIIHVIILASSLISFKWFFPNKENYDSIEVSMISNFDDLPTLTKKDASKAVEKALNDEIPTPEETKQKKEEITFKESEKSAPKQKETKTELTLKPKENIETQRTNRIERLRRIQRLKESKKTTGKGTPEGTEGIEGTTVAQTTKQGVQNWFIQKVIQPKIYNDTYVLPKFDGDTPRLLTIIVLKLNKDGSIQDLYIDESSGNKIYDDLMFGAVKRAAPFGNIPDEFQELLCEIGIGLRFKRTDFE